MVPIETCLYVRLSFRCLRRRIRNLPRVSPSYKRSWRLTKERWRNTKKYFSEEQHKLLQVRDIEHGTIPHNKQPKEVLKVKPGHH